MRELGGSLISQHNTLDHRIGVLDAVEIHELLTDEVFLFFSSFLANCQRNSNSEAI